MRLQIYILSIRNYGVTKWFREGPRNALTRCGGIMKIKVRDEKITKAIKKLEGIDIILKTAEDAKKAMRLILRKTEISSTNWLEGLKDIAIIQVVEHSTSAVEYQTYYEVEFILTDDRFIEMEIALIKELQAMFEKL